MKQIGTGGNEKYYYRIVKRANVKNAYEKQAILWKETKMVRLIDCEVYAVESIDITRLGLLSFFCNNHTDELVVVYSQEGMKGLSVILIY